MEHHGTEVAPLVGAWIEMTKLIRSDKADESLPLWERGLKFVLTMTDVARLGRSPCGSVD